jgi:hypothetical protein
MTCECCRRLVERSRFLICKTQFNERHAKLSPEPGWQGTLLPKSGWQNDGGRGQERPKFETSVPKPLFDVASLAKPPGKTSAGTTASSSEFGRSVDSQGPTSVGRVVAAHRAPGELPAAGWFDDSKTIHIAA